MFLSRCLTKSIVFSALCVTGVNAASAFPRGCEVSGFGYEQNFLILNETGAQSYYLIQNRSDSKIQLERHDTEEAFMSPPLQADLDPLNWAAFASDVQNVNFKCYKQVDEHTSLVHCKDVLDVCQYPRARFALSNRGNYWITVNKTQHVAIQDSVAKGIYLKW
jgi:hypothetical protein